MKVQLYDEYHFFHGYFEADNSGKKYKIIIPKYDRFYKYMMPHFSNEKVVAQTNVMIDDIIIDDMDKSFFNEKTFTLNTLMLAKDKTNVVHSFSVEIKGLKLNKTRTSKIAYEDGKWILSLFELQIPYCASIRIVENTDN